MIISANATAIIMTNFPIQPVKEGSVVEYVCETNYAYCTDPPAVLWFVGNVSVNASDVHTKENYTSPWTYRKMTKSTLRITVDRKLNNVLVKCVLVNDGSKLSEHHMNVRCKYMLVKINQGLQGLYSRKVLARA